MDRINMLSCQNDLEIKTKIFPRVDNTLTSFGKIELEKALDSISIKSTSDLVLVVKFLHENKDYTKKIVTELKKIHKYSGDVNSWITNPRDYNLEWVWNQHAILSTMNYIESPKTVITYLTTYPKLYNIIPSLSNIYLQLVTLLTYICYESVAKIFVIATILTGVCYVIVSVVTSYFKHKQKCADFISGYKNVKTCISACKMIFDYDQFKNILYRNEEIKSIENSFQNLRGYFAKQEIGEIVVESINSKNFNSDLNNVFTYAGKTDMYVSNSKLLDLGYCSPVVDLTNTKPFVGATKLWNPLLDYKSQIRNDISIGLNEKNTTILTGPNRSGKSTFMRSLVTSVYLAQSLGVTSAESFYFTPFDDIFTYLNVTDIAGQKSLFEAELEKCFSYYNKVMSLESNKKVIGSFDELFTGTNYLEGMSGSYGIIKKIAEIPNAVTLVATHFHEICDIPNISYYKFSATEKNGDYEFTHILEKGVSTQSIALDLLKQRGYSDEVIKSATEKLSKHKSIETK